MEFHATSSGGFGQRANGIALHRTRGERKSGDRVLHRSSTRAGAVGERSVEFIATETTESTEKEKGIAAIKRQSGAAAPFSFSVSSVAKTCQNSHSHRNITSFNGKGGSREPPSSV